jgi:hypothetical protein
MTRLQWSSASGAAAHPEIRFSMALGRALAFTRYAKALAGCAMRKYGAIALKTQECG